MVEHPPPLSTSPGWVKILMKKKSKQLFIDNLSFCAYVILSLSNEIVFTAEKV
jgi:hypothetical protein